MIASCKFVLRTHPRATTLLGFAFALLFGLSSTVEARITRIAITSIQSPALGGASFGDVGQFEKLTGTAYGEVDPHHPLNKIIQDIDLAPRNARGMVEYSTDIYILKPIEYSTMPRAFRGARSD